MVFQPDLLLECLNIDLSSTTGIAEYKGSILKQTLLKKYVPVDRQASLDAEAKANFRSLNDTIRNGTDMSDWLEDPDMLSWRDEIHHCFREYTGPRDFDWGNFLNHGYTGPGASRLSPRNDFVTKMFDSKLSTTSVFLYSLYKGAISSAWCEAEEIRFSQHGIGMVEGSVLSSVPKDKDKNRTICTEPTLNMFYQLGAKHVIENILEYEFDINMSVQPDVNKALAKFASSSGSLSTLDMKNASDSISMDLSRFLLPKRVYDKLCTMRSKFTSIDGEALELNMMSTMGNGFTFPLMSLIFSCCLKVVYRKLGLVFRNKYHTQQGRIFLTKYTTFGVFGDDLICQTEATEHVVQLLNKAGFILNMDKSFTSGPFRESCGGDYFLGQNVRGIYIKEVKHEADIYSIFNRLFHWSVDHGIPLILTLRKLLEWCRFQPVPLHAGVNEGLRIPSDFLLSPKSDRNGALLYRAYRPTRYGFRISDSFVNPRAAEIAAIGGYIRDQFIAERPNAVNYKIAKLKTPCWDYNLNVDVLHQELVQLWGALLERTL